MQNRVLIIEATSSCGDSNPIIATFAGLRNPQPMAQVSADKSEATVRLGISNGGREDGYKLCWGFNPFRVSDYTIEVGPFYFRGLAGDCVADGLTVTCSDVR
ncbi:unnamed protein product [Polarella glacialis]|nr:unnamed protein product [Polarella glacialis]